MAKRKLQWTGRPGYIDLHPIAPLTVEPQINMTGVTLAAYRDTRACWEDLVLKCEASGNLLRAYATRELIKKWDAAWKAKMNDLIGVA